MADRKFSDFTNKTDPILTDTVGLFDITGGTPAEQNRRMTWANAFKIVDDFPLQATPLASDTTNIFSGGIAMKATFSSLIGAGIDPWVAAADKFNDPVVNPGFASGGLTNTGSFSGNEPCLLTDQSLQNGFVSNNGTATKFIANSDEFWRTDTRPLSLDDADMLVYNEKLIIGDRRFVETFTSSRTMVGLDGGKVLVYDFASAATFTIPNNVTEGIKQGTYVRVINNSNFDLTIVGEVGVTIGSTGGNLVLGSSDSADITKLDLNLEIWQVDIDASIIDIPLTVESYTDTSRLVTITDLKKHLVFQGVSPTTLTLPELSTETLPQGFTFRVTNGMPSTFTFASQGSDIVETTTGNLTLAQDETAVITLFSSSSPNSWQIDIDTAGGGALTDPWISTSTTITATTSFTPTTVTGALATNGSFPGNLASLLIEKDGYGFVSDMDNMKMFRDGSTVVYETETRNAPSDTFKFGDDVQLYGGLEYQEEITSNTFTPTLASANKVFIYPIGSGSTLSVTLPEISSDPNLPIQFSFSIRNDSDFEGEIFIEGADQFSSRGNVTTIKPKDVVTINIVSEPSVGVRRWFASGLGPLIDDFLYIKPIVGVTPPLNTFLYMGTLPVFATLVDCRAKMTIGSMSFLIKSYVPNAGNHASNSLDLFSSTQVSDFSVNAEEFSLHTVDQNTQGSQFLELYLFVTNLSSGPTAEMSSINLRYQY